MAAMFFSAVACPSTSALGLNPHPPRYGPGGTLGLNKNRGADRFAHPAALGAGLWQPASCSSLHEKSAPVKHIVRLPETAYVEEKLRDRTARPGKESELNIKGTAPLGYLASPPLASTVMIVDDDTALDDCHWALAIDSNPGRIAERADLFLTSQRHGNGICSRARQFAGRRDP